MFFGSKNGPTRVDPSQVEDLANLKVTDARTGDTISVVGIGDEFADLDFTVDQRAMLEIGTQRWIEISGLYRNRRVSLETLNGSDGIQVFGHVDGRKITLDELGLTEEDLSEIDRRQNPADNFEFEEALWKYRWSREIGVFGERSPQGTGCYVWRFEDDKRHILTVRKLANEPFTAYVSLRVDPGDVTVYRG
ncbi:MAG TPA: hypothetical protein VHZ55_15225 [Bryobacteraceae bacterium]|nr:hypothetical protein [Bryobacteraceae bacterium]